MNRNGGGGGDGRGGAGELSNGGIASGRRSLPPKLTGLSVSSLIRSKMLVATQTSPKPPPEVAAIINFQLQLLVMHGTTRCAADSSMLVRHRARARWLLISPPSQLCLPLSPCQMGTRCMVLWLNTVVT